MTHLGKLLRSALYSLLILASPSVLAGTITYEYEGVCLTGCASIGLAANGTVSGYLEADLASLVDLVLTGEEIRDSGDFGFIFGSIGFDALNAFLSGFATLDADWNIIGGLFNINNLLTAANTLTFTPDGGGLFDVRVGFKFATGVGQYTSVPEPGTLTLLVMGLLGLGLASRRRRPV